MENWETKHLQIERSASDHSQKNASNAKRPREQGGAFTAHAHCDLERKCSLGFSADDVVGGMRFVARHELHLVQSGQCRRAGKEGRSFAESDGSPVVGRGWGTAA